MCSGVPIVKPDKKVCSKCRTEKSLDEFYTEKTKRKEGRPTSRCKVCLAEQSKAYYHANKEKQKELHKAWVKNNKDRVKYHKIKQEYGLSREEYDALKKICHICGSKDNLCVDHSHSSGRVRGILCSSCNKGLGNFKDDPTYLYRAADYILGKLDPSILNLSEDYTIKKLKSWEGFVSETEGSYREARA